MSLGPFSPERFEKFFAKVEAALPPPGLTNLGDCWLWTAYCDSQGYGRFYCPGFPSINGKPKHTSVLAHRWAMVFWYGPQTLHRLTHDHLCRRKACVSPRHGSAISNAENTARGNQLRHVSMDHEFLEFWGFTA